MSHSDGPGKTKEQIRGKVFAKEINERKREEVGNEERGNGNGEYICELRKKQVNVKNWTR